MGVDTNRETAIHLIQSVATGLDLSALAEDAIWWVPDMGEMTVPKFREAFDGFATMLESGGRMEVRGVTAEGDRVALEVQGFLPIKGKGTYSNRYHFLIEFRDGKVIRVKEFCDTAYGRNFFGG